MRVMDKRLKESEVTDRGLYLSRRHFLMGMGVMPLTTYSKGVVTLEDEQTPYKDVTTYNNFIEFGPGKGTPSAYAPDRLKTSPWTVQVDGACLKPATVDLDDLIRKDDLEERIYRFRCVEAWSMVIPWIGVPLSKVLSRFEPTSNAKYVEFTTLADKQQMPGLRFPAFRFPYVEGLRIDEAMHPLTLLAVGMYGQTMSAQNGAPIRLVVPWKYGFKSAKSIVRIRFSETQPETLWNRTDPEEYGFYANVNPEVSHPRWSQARERRIGDFFKRPTLPFNGYADEVANLYSGMDLAVNY